MSDKILDSDKIKLAVKTLLKKYNAESALLFGSYARGSAHENSDIDLVVFGGSQFKPTDIFALAEDLREQLGKDADVYEICEIDRTAPLYKDIIRDGIKIA